MNPNKTGLVSALTRRDFIRLSTAASIWPLVATGMSARDQSELDGPKVEWTERFFRALDHCLVEVNAVNVRREGNRLVAINETTPCVVVFTLGGQHIAEQAISDIIAVVEDKGQGEAPKRLTYRLWQPKGQDGDSDLEFLRRGREDSKKRLAGVWLSGNSRLAFELPAAQLPISSRFDDLLASCLGRGKLLLSDGAKLLEGNRLNEKVTSIEFPSLLYLAPYSNSVWSAPKRPVRDAKEAGLWELRLEAPDPADNRFGDSRDLRKKGHLRAIAFRDAQSAKWPFTENPGELAEGNKYAMNQVPSVPPSRRTKESLVSQISKGDGDITANSFRLSAIGATADLCYQPMTTIPVPPRKGAGDVGKLNEWIQKTSLGRDFYVKEAFAGFLMPFGLRAEVLTITERLPCSSATSPSDGRLTAFLVNRRYVRFLDRRKEFPPSESVDFDELHAQASRGLGMKYVEMILDRTPTLANVVKNLAQPASGLRLDLEEIGKGGDLLYGEMFMGSEVFWPRIGRVSAAGRVEREIYQIPVRFTYHDGGKEETRMPMLFVPSLERGESLYSASPEHLRGVDVAGRRPLAHPPAAFSLTSTALTSAFEDETSSKATIRKALGLPQVDQPNSLVGCALTDLANERLGSLPEILVRRVWALKEPISIDASLGIELGLLARRLTAWGRDALHEISASHAALRIGELLSGSIASTRHSALSSLYCLVEEPKVRHAFEILLRKLADETADYYSALCEMQLAWALNLTQGWNRAAWDDGFADFADLLYQHSSKRPPSSEAKLACERKSALIELQREKISGTGIECSVRDIFAAWLQAERARSKVGQMRISLLAHAVGTAYPEERVLRQRLYWLNQDLASGIDCQRALNWVVSDLSVLLCFQGLWHEEGESRLMEFVDLAFPDELEMSVSLKRAVFEALEVEREAERVDLSRLLPPMASKNVTLDGPNLQRPPSSAGKGSATVQAEIPNEGGQSDDIRDSLTQIAASGQLTSFATQLAVMSEGGTGSWLERMVEVVTRRPKIKEDGLGRMLTIFASEAQFFCKQLQRFGPIISKALGSISTSKLLSIYRTSASPNLILGMEATLSKPSLDRRILPADWQRGVDIANVALNSTMSGAEALSGVTEVSTWPTVKEHVSRLRRLKLPNDASRKLESYVRSIEDSAKAGTHYSSFANTLALLCGVGEQVRSEFLNQLREQLDPSLLARASGLKSLQEFANAYRLKAGDSLRAWEKSKRDELLSMASAISGQLNEALREQLRFADRSSLYRVRKTIAALSSPTLALTFANEAAKVSTEATQLLFTSWSPSSDVSGLVLRGFPRLQSMKAAIPNVSAPQLIAWSEDYIRKGVVSHSRAAGAVFAELRNEVGTAVRNSGVAQAAAKIEVLSREYGGLAKAAQSDLSAIERRVRGQYDELLTKGKHLRNQVEDSLLALKNDRTQYLKAQAKDLLPNALPKLFGVIPLDLIIQAAISPGELPKLYSRAFPDRWEHSFDWRTRLTGVTVYPLKFTPGPNCELCLRSHTLVRIPRPGVATLPPQSLTRGGISAFSVEINDLLRIKIRTLAFSSDNGKVGSSVKLGSDQAGGDVVEFLGPLKFVNDLRTQLKSLLSKSGLILSIDSNYIRAGLCISMPITTIGALIIENFTLNMSLGLPLGDGALQFRFSIATKELPLRFSISGYAGGGFLGLTLSTRPEECLIEASFEFGGSLAFSAGVAQGGLSLMAGLYFLRSHSGGTIFEGYVRLAGSVSVAGLIEASIVLYLGLSYSGDSNSLIGRASITVSVRIGFFSQSYQISHTHVINGSAFLPNQVDIARGRLLVDNHTGPIPNSSNFDSSGSRFTSEVDCDQWADYWESFAPVDATN